MYIKVILALSFFTFFATSLAKDKGNFGEVLNVIKSYRGKDNEFDFGLVDRCVHIMLEAGAEILLSVIPTMEHTKQCVEVSAAKDADDGSMKAMFRKVYEFIKKLVRSKPDCLNIIMQEFKRILDPKFDKFDKLECIEDLK